MIRDGVKPALGRWIFRLTYLSRVLIIIRPACLPFWRRRAGDYQQELADAEFQ
jgi:hypothetical protein